ncbi:TPA: hypothetical protein JIZ13_01340 [Acinetobacter nosocomialis]|nr:hypothetical protein [Acinetobacter nosocomialis]
MKKIILFSALFISTSSFAADWVMVAASNKEDYYIDRSFYNYKKAGNTIDVWWKTINTQADNPYTSSKALVQYDCTNKKSKYLAYTEFYGSGDPINTNSKVNNSFKFIYPDSVDEAIWNVSCKTKGGGFYFKANNENQNRAKKIVEAYKQQKIKPMVLPDSIAEKYYNNELSPSQVKDLEGDISNGLVKLPY